MQDNCMGMAKVRLKLLQAVIELLWRFFEESDIVLPSLR